MGFLILGILVIVFFGPLGIALIALAQVRAMRRRLEDSERFAEMRAHRLADRLNRLEGGAPAPPVPPPPAAPQPAPPPRAPVEAKPAPPPIPVEVRVEPVRARPDLLATPFPPPPPRILLAPQPRADEQPKESVPLENLIGERILPRIGVVAIVLGLGLLVWYAWGQFGKEGKIALTASTGAVMVVAGVFLRRNTYTQLLGGCLIGGGWAVMYITAYAAHSVAASRIITDEVLGFAVLLAVSEAALIHALRYRSETITGLAYLLTIATLLLSPEPGPAAWGAIGLSAVILVVLAWRERWIRLCAVGAALLYVAEVVWLSKTPPASIIPAMGVLVALWLLWSLPDYFHRPKTEWDKRIHGLLVAINFAGVLVVAALIQNWFNLVYMGWVWLTLGALYAVNAILGQKSAWRPAYLASLAFAAVLLFVGAREQFAGLGPVFAWLAVSAALFGWGLWRKDEIPRFMGIVGLHATLICFWAVDRGLEYAFIPALAIASLLYAAAAVIAALRRSKRSTGLETDLVMPLSHVGALALGLAIWRYAPDLTAGTYFALGGLVLLLLGIRGKARGLVGEAVVFLSIPIIYLASETLTATGDVAGVSRRLASTVPVLLAWLLAGRFMSTSAPGGEKARGYFSVILFGGVFALLATELRLPQTPVAWALASGAWYLWSRLAKRKLEFVLAALGASGAAVTLAAAPDLLVPAVGWAGPVASGAILMAIFVAIHLASRRDEPDEVRLLAGDLMAAVIAVTGFTLLAREMTGMWLTGSWAVLGFALAAYGWFVRDRVSRWTSLLTLGACLASVAFLNLPQAPVTWALVTGTLFIWSRLTKRDLEFELAAFFAVGAVVLFAAAPALLVPAVGWARPVASGAILMAIFVTIHLATRRDIAEAVYATVRDVFGAAIAVTGFTLLAREMTGTWLTGSWAVLGFALAGYGFVVRDRVSRWSSMLVLGVCLGKVAIFDLATFEMPVKIATLLTLGAVMVTLSFVYARHHRRIVVYLAAKE